MGKTGQMLVYICVYSTILFTPIILQLTCAESLQQIFYQHSLSPLAAGGVVAAIMLPLAQVPPHPPPSMPPAPPILSLMWHLCESSMLEPFPKPFYDGPLA